MDQNQKRSEETVSENQSKSEEMNQNQMREETVGEISEEIGYSQKSSAAGESEDIVEEIGESKGKCILVLDPPLEDQNQRTGEKIVGEDYSSGEETVKYESNGEEDKDYESSGDDDDKWVRGKRCPVSDPILPHNLSRRKGFKTSQKCCSCGKRRDAGQVEFDFHYYCAICQVEFHRVCRNTPTKIIHPYHPQHPLIYSRRNREGVIVPGLNFDGSLGSDDMISSGLVFKKCSWCAKDHGEWFYRCQICHFSLDRGCMSKKPPLTIQNPKSHHHPLSLFPRPASFPCNACGLIDVEDPSYACYQCNYFVHHSCIGLPRVIKITRHPHRLSLTPNYLLTKDSTCRVCYENVDIRYGQYSSNHGDCSYVAHSKCATHSGVWDGEELEWQPDEAKEDIVAPYKKVGDDLIEHFGHHHHYLKLEKFNSSRDSGKQCEACLRSIISSPEYFYNCIECEYFLHEVCANLPRKLDHGLHIHSLFLDPYPLKDMILRCDVCDQSLSCWMYKCRKEGCIEKLFLVDVNCILVSECFTHLSHAQHPMFMCTTYGIKDCFRCQGCKKESSRHRLKCTECEFVLCYSCATIPNKVYYKYDEHPLSICYGEKGDVDGMYWCEVCEKKLDPKDWFYTNNDCATIHVNCVFGDSALVKPGHSFHITNGLITIKVEVVGNSSSRPTCFTGQHRCPHSVYIKGYIDGTVFDFCSFCCAMEGLRGLVRRIL